MNEPKEANIETVEVNIYGMRHGDKDGDALSTKGGVQVADSCLKNLADIAFHGYYSSLRKRGLQTAEVAKANTAAFTFSDLTIHRRAAFDYCAAPGVTNTKVVAEAEKAYRVRHGSEETLETWFQGSSEWTRFLRNRVLQGLKDVATEQAFDAGDYAMRNVFIGSHSPTIELAANDFSFPRLREADIIHYRFLVTKENGEITDVSLKSTTYIPRGF